MRTSSVSFFLCTPLRDGSAHDDRLYLPLCLCDHQVARHTHHVAQSLSPPALPARLHARGLAETVVEHTINPPHDSGATSIFSPYPGSQSAGEEKPSDLLNISAVRAGRVDTDPSRVYRPKALAGRVDDLGIPGGLGTGRASSPWGQRPLGAIGGHLGAGLLIGASRVSSPDGPWQKVKIKMRKTCKTACRAMSWLHGLNSKSLTGCGIIMPHQ
jgi:hypothetical protein